MMQFRWSIYGYTRFDYILTAKNHCGKGCSRDLIPELLGVINKFISSKSWVDSYGMLCI